MDDVSFVAHCSLSTQCVLAEGGGEPFVQAGDNACQVKGTSATNRNAATGERGYQNTSPRGMAKGLHLGLARNDQPLSLQWGVAIFNSCWVENIVTLALKPANVLQAKANEPIHDDEKKRLA